MTDASKHITISNNIKSIIKICKNDESLIELAIVNFKNLLNAMKLYERAPRLFNAMAEDDDNAYNQNDNIMYKPLESREGETVLNTLDKFWHRKLKQPELVKIGTKLSSITNIKLERKTKRSKVLLTKWFNDNWKIIYQAIIQKGIEFFEVDN